MISNLWKYILVQEKEAETIFVLFTHLIIHVAEHN